MEIYLKNELTNTGNMNKSQNHAEWKKPDIKKKEWILCGHIYVKL